MSEQTRINILSDMPNWTATILLICLYSGCTYFGAATASMHDSYIPGIDGLKLIFNPLLIIGILLGTLFLTGNRELSRITRNGMAWCIIISILMTQVVMDIKSQSSVDHSYPGERMLLSTIWQSLSAPSFSNRSIISFIASAVMAGICFLIAGLFYSGKDSQT